MNPTSYGELMQMLGPDARLVCVRDHHGNILKGEEPEPDEYTVSADFLAVALSLGYGKGKK